jgi:hypothetical protein
MATQVTITQVKSVVDIDPPNGDYRFRLVSTVVVDSSDTGFTEPEVFLLNSTNDDFEHTCMLGDYLNFPKVKPTPPIPVGEEFYRVATVQLDYENLADAVAEADLQLVRLQNLVTDWENYADNSWTGSTPTVITGD